MKTHRLDLQTWQSVDAYLERARAIIIPIGSTEQHGPNGILGTDFITAETIARGLGERTHTLVAPTIPVGMALHHLAFAGTISLRPETLMAVLRDYIGSLYQHGFRGFAFINGHGGNIATARAALSNIHEQHPDAVVEWINWYMAGPVQALSRQLFGDREGSHATPSEVSVTMAAYPDHVEVIDGPLDIEVCRYRGITSSKQFREWYPDGRMASDPSLARREHGEQIIATAIESLSPAVTALQDRVKPARG